MPDNSSLISALRRWWRSCHHETVESAPRSGRRTALGLPAALSQEHLEEIAANHHPLIVGLFAELPEPHTAFPLAPEWLRLAKTVLGEVYRDPAPGLRASTVSAVASGEGNESGTGAGDA